MATLTYAGLLVAGQDVLGSTGTARAAGGVRALVLAPAVTHRARLWIMEQTQNDVNTFDRCVRALVLAPAVTHRARLWIMEQTQNDVNTFDRCVRALVLAPAVTHRARLWIMEQTQNDVNTFTIDRCV